MGIFNQTNTCSNRGDVMKQIKYPYGLLWLKCKEVLFSWYRHHFNECSCENRVFVDGGIDYLRCGAVDISKTKKVKIKIILTKEGEQNEINSIN